jgi:uncharacterized membrane protein YhiD involved in acid resistance
MPSAGEEKTRCGKNVAARLLGRTLLRFAQATAAQMLVPLARSNRERNAGARTCCRICPNNVLLLDLRMNTTRYLHAHLVMLGRCYFAGALIGIRSNATAILAGATRLGRIQSSLAERAAV